MRKMSKGDVREWLPVSLLNGLTSATALREWINAARRTIPTGD